MHKLTLRSSEHPTWPRRRPRHRQHRGYLCWPPAQAAQSGLGISAHSASRTSEPSGVRGSSRQFAQQAGHQGLPTCAQPAGASRERWPEWPEGSQLSPQQRSGRLLFNHNAFCSRMDNIGLHAESMSDTKELRRRLATMKVWKSSATLKHYKPSRSLRLHMILWETQVSEPNVLYKLHAALTLFKCHPERINLSVCL